MFLDLIRARRSVRKFTSRPIDENTRAQILEAALRSPSSRGLNPWRFIAVDDPKLLDRLSRSKPHGASFLKNAPLGIVVCADTTISDVCVEDAAIASTFIHLAAADLGLGSCWIQIRNRNHTASLSSEDFIKDLLLVPDNLMIESIIAMGYPDEQKKGHGKNRLEFDKIFTNYFGRKG